VTRLVRGGLVGFGRLARSYYLPALRSMGLLPRLAIADPSPASRDVARSIVPGDRVYADYRALLHEQSLDVLLVASPPSSHLEIWRAAAARGLPVFMEKPFLSSFELDAIDPGAPTWRRLMVDFNRRFWPPYRSIGAHVRSGTIGRPRRARLVLCVDIRAWRAVTDHRLEPGEGGVLYDLGGHMLDLAATLLAEAPAEISARRSGDPAREQYDLDLLFPSGATARCEVAYSRRAEESVRIDGEHGSVYLANPNCRVHVIRPPRVAPSIAARCTDVAALATRALIRGRSMLRYSTAAALESFVRTVEQGGRFSPGFDEALRVARWLAAAECSARTRTPIVLAPAAGRP
jgi:predicted dehydrogenase